MIKGLKLQKSQKSKKVLLYIYPDICSECYNTTHWLFLPITKEYTLVKKNNTTCIYLAQVKKKFSNLKWITNESIITLVKINCHIYIQYNADLHSYLLSVKRTLHWNNTLHLLVSRISRLPKEKVAICKAVCFILNRSIYHNLNIH